MHFFLQFLELQYDANYRLASFILEFSGLIAGFYAPCSHSQVSNHLTVLAESLPSELSEASLIPEPSRGNRNRCSVPGILYNTNTVESFHALDKSDLLKKEAAKVDRDYSIPLFI